MILTTRLLVSSFALVSTTAFQTSTIAFYQSRNVPLQPRNQLTKSLRSANDGNDEDIIQSIDLLGVTTEDREIILSNLQRSGLWEPSDPTDTSTSNTLGLLARDFVDRPEAFSTILISDFNFPPLAAHQTRAVVMNVLKKRMNLEQQQYSVPQIQGNAVTQPQHTEITDPVHEIDQHKTTVVEPWTIGKTQRQVLDQVEAHSRVENVSKAAPPKKKAKIISPDSIGLSQVPTDGDSMTAAEKKKPTGFKAAIVNEKAKVRHNNGEYEYSLNEELYPKLKNDLEAFFAFMTRPSPHSQEDPIREATAEVYMRHARQFLGWYVTQEKRPVLSSEGTTEEQPLNNDVSLQHIIPNKEKDSANDIIDFVLWLRSRDVSVSYEANILRGLTKLLKFRFSRESEADSSADGTTFADIPLIKEIRKLHRDANKRQKKAPRSSNEQKKWLSWPEYLQVIKSMKQELLDLMDAYFSLGENWRKVKAAEAYQSYLILSLFASIPDRQRTMRELAIGSTLVKSDETNLWTVRHGPDDYKTGKSYGERPTIQLREDLSLAIDDFIENWRSALEPSTDFLFAQSRTGKPLTANGIFQRVSRCCFNYGGKRTNPHLLRDMIVTYVRESDASEKELEALALYMGHSLNMQRTSYDRRTLTTKIAPAVELMQSINTDAK